MKKLVSLASTLAASLCIGSAAVAQTEVSFYFPVAVGGPVTKIIDGYAVEFNKENPDLKVVPVYAAPDVRINVASNMCVTGATRKWNGSVLSGVQTESGGSVVAA